MPAFDPLTYRYPSRRNVVYVQNAVACTSVPLGAQIGLDVMKSGGSAVDAAVAVTLPAVQTCSRTFVPRG